MSDEAADQLLFTCDELDRILRNHMGRWSSATLPSFRIVSSKPNILTIRILVHESLTNARNNLHGGALASIVDVATSAAVFVVDPRPSVTIDLHVTCLYHAPLHSTITVEAKVERVGQSMVFCSCRIIGEDDRLVATALHTKKVVGPKEDVVAIRSRL